MKNIRKTLIQVTALSIGLFVITDYMETQWWFQTMSQRRQLEVNNVATNTSTSTNTAAATTTTNETFQTSIERMEPFDVVTATMMEEQQERRRRRQQRRAVVAVDANNNDQWQQQQQQQQQQQLRREQQEDSSSSCFDDIVYNGNAETGTTAGWNGIWGHPIHIASPGATGSAFALEEDVDNATMAAEDSYALDDSLYHFSSLNRTHPLHGMFQRLTVTTDCWVEGSTWRFSGRFRLFNPVTNRSTMDACTLPHGNNYGDCPFFLLSVSDFDLPGTHRYLHDYDMMIHWDPTGWNEFHVLLTLDDSLAGPNKHNWMLLVCGGTSLDDSVFLADDIHVERLEQWELPTSSPTSSPYPTAAPTMYCNKNWAGLEGFHFDTLTDGYVTRGNLYGWSIFSSTAYMGAESPGYGGTGYAMKVWNRESWAAGPFLWHVDVNCVTVEDTWRVHAKVKLYNEQTGEPDTLCGTTGNEFDCPLVRMLLTYRHHPAEWLYLTMDDLDWKTDGSYSTFQLEFSVPPHLVRDDLYKFAPFFAGGKETNVLVLDDIILQRLGVEATPTSTPTTSLQPSSSPTVYCNRNFIRNHDGEFGTTAYWIVPLDSNIELVSPGYGDEQYALASFHRQHWTQGLSQRISPRCFEVGSVWRLRFRTKIVTADHLSQIASCDNDQFECPLLRLAFQTQNGGDWHYRNIFDEKLQSNWNSNLNEWNTFDVVYKTEDDLMQQEFSSVLVDLCGGTFNTTLYVDDVNVERLEEWETPTSTPTDSMVPSESPSVYCIQEFAKNGNMEVDDPLHNPDGITPWNGWGNPIRKELQHGRGVSLGAYNRSSWHRGAYQTIDPICVTLNSTWHVQAKVKLYEEETGQPITNCQPGNVFSKTCPMVRTIITKTIEGEERRGLFERLSTSTSEKENNRRNLQALDNEVYLTALWRDTNMVWNNNGDWVDLDLQITLTPEMSGDNINMLAINFVGGPAYSVLVLDDVSITRVDENTDAATDFSQESHAAMQTCHSIGDPHIQSFDQTLFDNHELGWQLLYGSPDGSITIETQHEPFVNAPSATYNHAYRITQDGIIVEEGTEGQVPAILDEYGFYYMNYDHGARGGLYIRLQPVLVDWIENVTPFYMYYIYITTSIVEGSTGLCSPSEQHLDAFNMDDYSEETLNAAQTACQEVITTTSIFEACVRDVLLLAPVVSDTTTTAVGGDTTTTTTTTTNELVTLSATAEEIELTIDAEVQQLNLDSVVSNDSDDEEVVLAHEAELLYDADPYSMVLSNNNTLSHEFTTTVNDTANANLQNSLADQVEAEGDAQAESISGVEGDPVILGLQHQNFDFHGNTEEWYANFASSGLQWNMKFHHFDACTGEEAMYVTSMALTVHRAIDGDGDNNDNNNNDNAAPPHQIIISIVDEAEVFPGCPNAPHENCLSEGSLQINVDGEYFTKPGDYRMSDDLRIVSFNTWEACARKWVDYNEGIHKHDYHYDNLAVHRRERKLLQQQQQSNNEKEEEEKEIKQPKKSSRLFDISSFLSSKPKKSSSQFRKLRQLGMSSRETLDYLRQMRSFMVSPHECSDWIERRTHHKDLFEQTGGWANVFIETPHARFQIQHRQIQKEREYLENGGSGFEKDIIVEGLLFEGNQHQCQSHVLDGWLTHTSHELKQEDWHGILGETQTMKYNEAGQPILTNRNRILGGTDDDYRVIVGGAFGTEFAARNNNNHHNNNNHNNHQQRLMLLDHNNNNNNNNLFKLDDEVVYHTLWDDDNDNDDSSVLSKTNKNLRRALKKSSSPTIIMNNNNNNNIQSSSSSSLWKRIVG